MLRFSLILAVFALSTFAQTTTIEVQNPTPTQAVLHVRATDSGGLPYASACTYRASEGQSFVAAVNDVSTTLYTGANSDARAGAIVNGPDRYFVLGTRNAVKALDGKWYSRALQADTWHWAGVTCGGAEVSTTFKTQNPPLGNGYPESPAFDPSAFGNRAQPTVDFTDKTKSYIDPLTGVLIKRISGPLDVMSSGGLTPSGTRQPFTYVRDMGSAWTNVQNALTNQVSGTLASTSTVNAPLFIAWSGFASSSLLDTAGTVNDLNLRNYCSGTGGGKIRSCISLDSGQTCNSDVGSGFASTGNGIVQEITCPGSVGEVQTPANYPSPMFQGWGVQTLPLNKANISNSQPPPLVWASGSTIHYVSGYSPFYTQRAAGSKLSLPASSCALAVCTVASIDSSTQITISETLTADVGGSLLTGTATAGATSVAVSGSAGLYAGHHVVLEQGTANQETMQVTTSWTAGSTTLNFTGATSITHAAGTLAFWGGTNDDNPGGGSCAFAAIANVGATTITVNACPGLARGMRIQLNYGEFVTVANTYTMGSTTVPLNSAITLSAGYVIGNWITWQVSEPMQDLGAGLRIWMASTGGSPTVATSFSYDTHFSYQFLGGQNAAFDTCSGLPVHDVNTNGAGAAYGRSYDGYLCSALNDVNGTELNLWIPELGEMRLQSTYYQAGTGYRSVPKNPFSAVDPLTFFASANVGGVTHLFRGVLAPVTAHTYLTFQPGITLPPAADTVTWTDVSITASPITTQLTAYGGPAAAAYATGLFSAPDYGGVIGGYGVFSMSAWNGVSGTADGPCIKVRVTADTNTLIQAFTSWDGYNLRWGGCHSAPGGIGPYLNLSIKELNHFDASTPLGGPFYLRVTQMFRGGTWKTYSQAIGSATATNPVSLTGAVGLDDQWPNNYGTGYGKGPWFTPAGGTGSWAALNGIPQRGTLINAGSPTGTFTLPVNASGYGTYPGGMTAAMTPPLIQSTVSNVTTATPAVITTQAPLLSVEPNAHQLQDGDGIAFGPTPTTQYYAKVTGYTANTFGLYADQALTSPVSGSPAPIQAFASGSVYNADTCPTGLPAIVTTGLPFDGGVGAVGPRCITFRVAGDPVSDFSTSAEHTAYPAASDPSNVLKSSLSTAQVGDNIHDGNRTPYGETFVVVKRVVNSANDIELTLMRFYGRQIGGSGTAAALDFIGCSHDIGWQPILVPSNYKGTAVGWMGATDVTNTFIPSSPDFALDHGAFGYGNAPGLYTFTGGAQDAINNVSIATVLGWPTVQKTNSSYVPWANSSASQMGYPGLIQSYPGHAQINALPVNHRWASDWNAILPDAGGSPAILVGLLGGQTFTLVGGTTRTYKVGNAAGAYDIKRSPLYAWSGQNMYGDKSGPGSTIGDSDLYRFCVNHGTNECRTGAALNDTFMVIPSYFPTGYCTVNQLNVNSPCFSGANPMAGWAIQKEIDPIDTSARRIRRLTQGFNGPAMQPTYQTWLQEPTGTYAFFSSFYVNGLRTDAYMAKLPPWPVYEQPSDSRTRTDFVQVPRQIGAMAGSTTARIRFGYAENGAANLFYCTSRAEPCATDIPSGAPTDPYSFASDAVTRQTCSSGCTIYMPVIPGRVVYFTLDRLDAGGAVIFSGPLEALAVP